MRVGYFQFEPAFLDVEANIIKIQKTLGHLSNVDLIVLPELANSGYLFSEKAELEECAEEIPEGPFVTTLMEIAKERNFYIVSGVCEKRNESYYNSSVLVGPEGHIGTYRKVHLFDREKLFFKAGNSLNAVFQVRGAKVGLLICFDWLFPEATRVLALQGMEILAHSANLVMPYCQRAMLARAVENRIFAITANRIGEEKNNGLSIKFTGQSQIVSPTMEILASSPENVEEVSIVEINLELARNKWLNERNSVLEDRRPELYELITKQKK